MAEFALVHGGWFGAWCWDRLTPLLRKRGHRVVTMDLPADDATATSDSYADTVCAALADCGEDVVLVGHSMAGLTLPVVAARRPAGKVVYLCALVPAIGQSFFEQFGDHPDLMCPGWDAALSADEQGRTFWSDPDLTRELLFADCDDQTVAATYPRMRSQVGAGDWPFMLTELPPAPSVSIYCTEDRMVNPAWSVRVAQERLGAEVIAIPGGHCPFLSRPAALAGVLDRIADPR